MGYLVCDKCGGYYELQPGESPEDFSDECECGGKTRYVENLEGLNNGMEEMGPTIICPLCGAENPKGATICKSCKRLLNSSSSTKKTSKESKPLFGGLKVWWDKQNKPIKAGSIVGICCIGIILIIGTIGLLSPDTNTGSFQTYSNQYMSFQYPLGWYAEANAVGGVNIKENSTQNTTDPNWFAVNIYGKNLTNNINDFNSEIATLTSGKTIKTGNINGISFNYTTNPNSNVKTSDSYYFEKNGKLVIISAYVNDTTVIKKVISTFN